MPAPARLLVDAGPLVALFNRRDGWHRDARAFFSQFRGVLVSTWPVLAEACYFIGARAPQLIDLIEAQRIDLVELEASAGRVAALMRSYADLPMDLADATLVVAAERTSLVDILTLDRHFGVYRLRGGARFTIWALSTSLS